MSKRTAPIVHPDLPTALRAALEASGCTQAAVYEAMGYAPGAHGSSPALSRALNGHRKWTNETLAVFAKVTGQTLRYQIDGVEITVRPGMLDEADAA